MCQCETHTVNKKKQISIEYKKNVHFISKSTMLYHISIKKKTVIFAFF